MNINEKNNFLFANISSLKGVGIKTSKFLKKKKIETINDLLWNLPYSYTDRSNLVTLDKLEVGKILTIKIKVIKYNFPRIRNLPNRIICEDQTGRIDLIYFNSREGYIKKILPLNSWVVVSGKINFFKNKYQITNPNYVSNLEKLNIINKKIPKYSLTEGLTEKSYNKMIDQVLNKLSNVDEWLDLEIIKKYKFISWKDSILKLHQIEKSPDLTAPYYKRIALEEIISHFLVLSEFRKKIKKIKKNKKIFMEKISGFLIKNLTFKLTNSQKQVIKEINKDLNSNYKMFRILQGDVGSGKTIVSIITASNVIESGYQCAMMAPTEILAKQHYNLVKKIFANHKINISFLSGKIDYADRKRIIKDLKEGTIDFIIGTHSLFQTKIEFKKLGLIIIDEQHKFGVKQRMNLAKKGGDNCDVLLMSATPIPRTMVMAIYGDMDTSKITEKPHKRKKTLTLSKPEEKLDELWPYIKKNISEGNQVFWVCPLIDQSKFLDYSSAKKRFELINKKFPNRTGLIHGALDKNEKEKILNKFLNKEIDIIVSTTVIEVGIDFPNANLIIIENSNKFGMAQLHQLRGRVGRGKKQGICILLFKGSLSKNAVKRIKILKLSDDGFFIAEEDMKLRGYGDIIGFQQSGVKYFKIADPIIHEDLFIEAKRLIDKIKVNEQNIDKFKFLLKLFDRAEVINQ